MSGGLCMPLPQLKEAESTETVSEPLILLSGGEKALTALRRLLGRKPRLAVPLHDSPFCIRRSRRNPRLRIAQYFATSRRHALSLDWLRRYLSLMSVPGNQVSLLTHSRGP